MNYAEFKQWCDEAGSRNATFVSLYRASVTTDEAWNAFKELHVSGAEIEETAILVQPGGAGFS